MFKEIFAISNYPNLQQDGGFFKKLLTIFKTYGIVVLVLISVGPILLLADKFVTDVLHHKSLNAQNREMFKLLYKRAGVINAFIFICIVGPVFEELIFRLALKFKKREVFITLLIALFYFGGSFFHPKTMMLKVYLEIAIALTVAGVGIAFIPNTPFNLSQQRKTQLVITSIVLFGLMHISNYRPMDWALIWIYPLFVIPQILIGWGITYVRFKNGFVWGIALHCLVNTITTVLTLTLKK